MSEPLPRVQPGNVILAVLVGFIVVWGLVYGLWRDGWWLPAGVLVWVLAGSRRGNR